MTVVEDEDTWTESREEGGVAPANDFATTSLIHYGVSETLIANFEALAEQTELDGRLRHPVDAIQKLRSIVLCRVYSDACLELAWWMHALVQGGGAGAVLHTVYNESLITRGRVLAAVHAGRLRLPAGSRLEGAQLHLQHQDLRFVLHLDRLPLWIALLELLAFIDPKVPGNAALDGSPGEIANRLQRLLYAYLAIHAQPLHQQRRLSGMLKWLRAATPNKAPLQAINDVNVLSYWRQPPEDAQDITRLRTVIDAFLCLREALSAVQRASAAGQSVPFEELAEGFVVGEAAEVWLDPEDLDLCALSNYPRFLTTRAAETLQLLAKHPEAIHRLPLSLARHAVWGELQARWIEAGKRRRLIDPREESRSYSQWIEALSECRDELQQIQSATLGVLLQQGEVTAVLAVLAESQPELATWLRQRAAVQERLDGAWLASWRLRHAPLNAALQRVERALKTTTRSGFKGADDFADSAIYLNALQAIAALISRVGRLQAQRADWSADFTTDRSIVRQRLLALHAGDTDSHDPHV